MDRGAWWAAVHGVARSRTRLSDFTFTFTFLHWRRKWQPTRVLAWRIPGMGEPGGLPSMGSHRVGHDWSNLAAAAKKGSLSCADRKIPLRSLWQLPKLTFSGLSLPQDAARGETSLVQFSCSVVSDSLRPHGLQHVRLPCPSPTPWAYSHSCYPTISSTVFPFFSRLQSFPASGSFPMSQFFASGGQSIGASASASALPMTIQDWFPLGWTGCISLQSKGLSRVYSNTTVQKHQFFGT